jgi:hypothetical protein
VNPILAEEFAFYTAFLWIGAMVAAVVGLRVAQDWRQSAFLLGVATLVGAVLVLSMFPVRGVHPLLLVTTPIPALLGLSGLVVWFRRNRSRFNPGSVRAIFYVGLVCLFVLVLTIVLVSKE